VAPRAMVSARGSARPMSSTAKIARRRCRVYEVPISYDGRDYAEGKKIGWKDAVAAFYFILRFRISD